MKYECKENDAIIELGRDKDEVLIYIQGETAKTVIGLKDLHQALNMFDVVERSEQLVSFLRQYQNTCEIMHLNKIDAKNFVELYKTN